MKKVLKWISLTGGIFLVMISAVLLIIPLFLDTQKYKLIIEQRVREATGRSLTVGDDIGLCLFPKTSLSFSDLHLGNSSGFKEKDFLTIRDFEVGLKLLPFILSRFQDIQVKGFTLNGPLIKLVKYPAGRKN